MHTEHLRGHAGGSADLVPGSSSWAAGERKSLGRRPHAFTTALARTRSKLKATTNHIAMYASHCDTCSAVVGRSAESGKCTIVKGLALGPSKTVGDLARHAAGRVRLATHYADKQLCESRNMLGCPTMSVASKFISLRSGNPRVQLRAEAAARRDAFRESRLTEVITTDVHVLQRSSKRCAHDGGD